MKQEYQKLNLLFKKELVFRLGSDSGFFSEYNNMVLAILYCLKNQIKFTLSSNKANFSDLGWEDFFDTFCPKVTNSFHLKNNVRSHHKLSSKRNIFINIYKLFSRKYLTQDFWGAFHSRDFEKEVFDVPTLQIFGNTLSASKKIVKLTWNYKDATKTKISEIIKTVGLPEKYVAIHIRRGDKVKETASIDVKYYIEKLKTLTSVKDVFVATDDFSVIEYLTINHSDMNFYHLTDKKADGYNQTQFENLNARVKRNQLLKLFATIEILVMSKVFVGTFNSNIGMYMAMRLGTDNVYGVDFDDWRIW